jgi:ubiquinone/menaquinone biosynthesis C-methylase UbiE
VSSDDYSFIAFSEHPFYRRANLALLDRADLKRGWTVVDVACGNGAITELILDRIRGARDAMVIGVDMSASALQEAAEKVADARDAVVEFVQCRAEEMSNRIRRPVDAVVFCNGIHYIEDKKGLLEEVYRTLKPGGIFAFNSAFFDGTSPPETQKYYRRWMLKALRKLKTEYDLKPDHSKVESRKQLTAEEYGALLEAEGFEIKSQEPRRPARDGERGSGSSDTGDLRRDGHDGVAAQLADGRRRSPVERDRTSPRGAERPLSLTPPDTHSRRRPRVPAKPARRRSATGPPALPSAAGKVRVAADD